MDKYDGRSLLNNSNLNHDCWGGDVLRAVVPVKDASVMITISGELQKEIAFNQKELLEVMERAHEEEIQSSAINAFIKFQKIQNEYLRRYPYQPTS